MSLTESATPAIVTPAQRPCHDTTQAIMRLRGEVMAATTSMSWLRDALSDLENEIPGLKKRRELALITQHQARRIVELECECSQWQRRFDAALGEGSRKRERDEAPRPPIATPSPLTRDLAAAGWADAAGMVPLVLTRTLAARLVSDAVLCQTGCISHQDYWRKDGECRRTGQACILENQNRAEEV